MTHRSTDISIDRTRVIGVFAHVDAGKTTVSEAILYYTGRIHRVGRVDDGDTQLDWMAQERERGITVTSAATTCLWKGCRVNLIDTPGHVDFSAEVVRSIRVIDAAVIVLCGVGGVEAQTEAVWTHADRCHLPRILFVNKLDRPGADFARTLADVRATLTPRAVAIQWPLGREGDFHGIVDLIGRRALIWPDGVEDPTAAPVPPAMAPEVERARERLVDAICETDDALLSRRLAGEEPGEPDLAAALRRATIRGSLAPVLCGSALKRIAITPLLDALADCLPSPRDAAATRSVDLDGPFCAVAFKIVNDRHVGHLTWVRVLGGRLEPGRTVCIPRTGGQERVSRMYLMHANSREQTGRIGPGDVAALVGVRSAGTGDCLCDLDHPVQLDAFGFPEPVIMVALAPPSEDQRPSLQQAVRRLCREDPTLTASYDAETGEQTLAGMGELHLEIAVDRLRREFGVDPEVSPPRVAFRETATRTGEGIGTYRRQSGGHGHFARVTLRVEPLERGGGLVFENVTTPPGGAPGRRRGRRDGIPAVFVRPVERGVREEARRGVLAGYPVADVRVTLVGGQFHEVDSAQLDFQLAASMAMREAVRRAGPALIEPVMRADISVAKEHVGAVTADLGRRRGRVTSANPRGDTWLIEGEVPLAETRRYATDLRSLAGGRCTLSLELLRYDLIPDDVADRIIAERPPLTPPGRPGAGGSRR